MGIPVADRNSMAQSQIGTTDSLTVRLYSALPSDEGVGGTELSGNGYSAVTHSIWTTASGGVVANSGAISYSSPTGAWLECVGAALWDGATFVGVTDTFNNFTAGSGDTVAFADGQLTFTIS